MEADKRGEGGTKSAGKAGGPHYNTGRDMISPFLAGAKVCVTALHGDVQVVSDGEMMKASVQRESEPWPELPKTSKK